MWGFFIFYKILIFINKIILTNQNLLIEDLKRIGFMMNYEPGKLVTENEKTSKNVIVENKIETLFTPKTSNDVISETTLKKAFKEVWESRQNLISEQWERTPPGKPKDPIGYWRALFDQLKATGIGVKWEVANDPVKSTFMYWGQWVIWKDTNKNGGWPISFSGTNKKLWLFKFKGGKYTGGSADATILESKFINSTFNLGQWGSFTGAAAQLDNLIKTKPKSAAASNVLPCKKPDGKPIPDNQVQAEADAIFKEIAYAFDGAGTYEAEAVAAYARITCKPLLDKINAKVAARGMSGIKNVQQWLTDEMSDYDYEQYRKIWASLQKVDKSIVAPKVNQLYRGAGIVGDVTGVNAIEKGAEGIQQLFTRPLDGFEKLIDAVRSFLGGVVGGVVTTILDFTGVGKVVTTIGWGILLLGDIITSSVRGVVKWAEIILDIITICTTGSFGAVVGKVLKPFFGAGSSLATLVTKLSKYTWFTSIVKALQTGISKVTGMLGKAIKWIMSTSWWKKLAGTSIGKFIGSAMSKATMFFDDMTKAMVTKGGAGSQAATTQVKDKIIKRSQEKIKTQLTTDAAEDLAWAGGTELAGDTGGERAKSAVNLTRAGSKLEKDLGDLSKGKKQIFTGTDPNQAKTLAKQTGALTKDTIKTVKTGSGVVAGEEEPENKTKKPVTSTLTPGQIKA